MVRCGPAYEAERGGPFGVSRRRAKSRMVEGMRMIRDAKWAWCGALIVALAPCGAWSAEASAVHEPHLKSTMAIVVDQDTDEVLYQKNADQVSSIASITKLMTAMVTLDSQLPLDEDLEVTKED